MDTFVKLEFDAIDAAFLKGLYLVDFSDLPFSFNLYIHLSVLSSENRFPFSIP